MQVAHLNAIHNAYQVWLTDFTHVEPRQLSEHTDKAARHPDTQTHQERTSCLTSSTGPAPRMICSTPLAKPF